MDDLGVLPFMETTKSLYQDCRSIQSTVALPRLRARQRAIFIWSDWGVQLHKLLNLFNPLGFEPIAKVVDLQSLQMLVIKHPHMRKKIIDFKKKTDYFWVKSECASLYICDTDQAYAYLAVLES